MKTLAKLLVSACSVLLLTSSLLAQENWDDVVAAAKKEGSVTFFTSFYGDKNQLAVVAEFEKETGIKVDMLDVRFSEIEQRLQAEFAAKRVSADVVLGSSDLLDANAETGVLGPFVAPPNASKLMAAFAPTETRVPIFSTISGLLVNSDLVKPEDEPKSWLDLTDPKWKGKIVADDFRAQGGGFIWFSSTLHKLGEQFQRDMAKQDIVFSRNAIEDQMRVARGEYAIKIPQNYGVYQGSIDGQGLPLKMVFPSEGATYTPISLGIAVGAPHPNAARVLVNYYLSETAQVALANMGQIPLTTGVIEKADPKISATTGALKLFATPELKNRDADVDLAKELYK